MTTSNAITLRRYMPIALALGALAVMSARAHADDLPQITISAPTVKTTGYDFGIGAPIEEATVTAKVKTDSAALTTNSGVALLKDNVRDAARKACEAADPLAVDDDDNCVRTAIKSAKPQIDAAIARAKSSANG